MELIQGSETSANYNLTPGKYPKEHIQYSNHGESLKSRMYVFDHISLSCSYNQKWLRKSCRENQNTYFMFNNYFFENHAVYEMMWKNILELGRSQMTVWHMPIACWVTKATDTHSVYVILISSPRQQWLCYTHYLSCYSLFWPAHKLYLLQALILAAVVTVLIYVCSIRLWFWNIRASSAQVIQLWCTSTVQLRKWQSK